MKITTQETIEKEALKLYSDLMIPDITALNKSTSRCKNKKENILNVLKNLESLFTGVYLHYDNVTKSELEPKCEEIIAERTKLRRQESAKQLDNTDMPDLESEESATQRRNQQGKGLKILTPNQMLCRLPISLAQLNAGNISEKLKHEIR